MGRSSLWALRATHYAPLSLRAQVSSASSGEEALRQVRHTPPDLVLLGLMLPAMGGLEVCRTLPPGALDGRAAHRDADGQEATRSLKSLFLKTL